MTEWNGIKVGGLYKRTGRGSRGASLAMAMSIEYDGNGWDGRRLFKLTTLEGGKLQCSWVSWSPGAGINVDGHKWPYKEVV